MRTTLIAVRLWSPGQRDPDDEPGRRRDLDVPSPSRRAPIGRRLPRRGRVHRMADRRARRRCDEREARAWLRRHDDASTRSSMRRASASCDGSASGKRWRSTATSARRASSRRDPGPDEGDAAGPSRRPQPASPPPVAGLERWDWGNPRAHQRRAVGPVVRPGPLPAGPSARGSSTTTAVGPERRAAQLS